MPGRQGTLSLPPATCVGTGIEFLARTCLLLLLLQQQQGVLCSLVCCAQQESSTKYSRSDTTPTRGERGGGGRSNGFRRGSHARGAVGWVAGDDSQRPLHDCKEQDRVSATLFSSTSARNENEYSSLLFVCVVVYSVYEYDVSYCCCTPVYSRSSAAAAAQRKPC